MTFGERLRNFLLEDGGIAKGYEVIVDEIFNELSKLKPHMTHRELILEWKSISDQVKKMCNVIGKQIINDSKSKEYQMAKTQPLVYKEGLLNLDFSNILDGLREIKVKYILYCFDSVEEYNSRIHQLQSYSYCNYDSNELMIVSAIINNQIAYDFYSTIMHETEHYFQYHQGMKKNDTLYNKVIELTKHGGLESLVGMCLYYTFQHEQDAFVNQFYGWLKQNKPWGESFEELLNYTEYKNFNDFVKQLKQYKAKDIFTILQSIGFDLRTFKQRINFAKRRLKNKLYNAYVRYRKELFDSNLTIEHIYRNQLMLENLNKKYPNIKSGNLII